MDSPPQPPVVGSASAPISHGATARRLSVHTKPQPTPEPTAAPTYALLLLGSLQHFAASAGGARIKEIPLLLDGAVRQVSCGADWLCLVTDAGRAYSFGSNTYGQLGQGHTRAVAHPKPVVGLPADKRVTRVSCGSSHGGFLLEGGALFMVGCGTYGRLGTGNETAQSSPVAVKMRWRELECAAATISREPGTTIPGFGRIASATPSSANPTAAGTVPRQEEDDDEVSFVDISCADRHTLLLGAKPMSAVSVSTSTTGSLKRPTKNYIIAFGDGMNGRLGIGSERDCHTGVLLTQFRCAAVASSSSATPTFTSVHAGASHNAAVSSAGELFTWGNGADGQLGHGTLESEWVPREVTFFRGNALVAAACGARHTAAVSRAGVVYTWGRGRDGQLGTGGVAPTSQPQRITLVVDPIAAQQAQIDAQLAAGATTSSFSTSSADHALFLPDPRVVVRTLVAQDTTTMALDEQARLFVWGDNCAGQLGLPVPDANDQQRDKDRDGDGLCVATPRQLSYMGLREPKKLASRVRDRVLGAAMGSLPRAALTHVAASDRFSVLVFRTKPPATMLGGMGGDGPQDTPPSTGGSSRSVGSVTQRLLRHQSTLVEALDDDVRWQLSLTEPLQLKDVPSREAAFYRYMAQYRVSIRKPPAGPESDDDDRYDDNDDRHDGVPPSGAGGRRATHALHGSHHNVRRSSVAAMSPELRRQLQDQFRCVESDDGDAEDDAQRRGLRHGSATRPAAETVKGFGVWLERQLSPSKSHGFGTAPRFRVQAQPTNHNRPNQKDDDVRTAAPARPRSSTPLSSNTRRRPCAQKSAFGRSAVPSSPRASMIVHLPRRPTTAAPGSTGWRSSSIAVATDHEKPASTSPPPSKDTRQRLFNQFVAPFGSSVGSRFGVALARANDSVQLDIYPEHCASAVLPRSPSAALGGNAEQFSQVIARRLREAKGTLPGPGTYDRHGG